MAYLGKGRREDLFVLATELNLKFDKSMTITTLKDLIIGSENYDEELTKNIHSTIVEDRKAREENLRIEEQKEKLRIEEQKEKLRIEEREEKLRFEQLRLDEQKRKDEFELEKLRIQTQSKLGADTSKESDTKFLVKEISKFIHRFDLKDISLYLKLFERQAQRLNIDQENWVSHLLGLLPTEVSHIIAREPDDKANSYEHVKDLLLKRFKLTPEKFRQLFVTHQKAPERTWIDFYHELNTYFNGWIDGLKIDTFEKLSDLIITDQIKRKTPFEFKEYYLDEWENMNSPVQLAEKLEEFEDFKRTLKQKSSSPFVKKQEFRFTEKNRRYESQEKFEYNRKDKKFPVSTNYNKHYETLLPSMNLFEDIKTARRKGITTKITRNTQITILPSIYAQTNYSKSQKFKEPPKETCTLIVKEGLRTKEIFFGKVKITALIDSGSTVSLLRENTSRRIMDPTKLSKNKMLLTGIGEAQVTTIGSFEHKFKIDDENYSLTWHVVPTDKLKFEAVIGSDLLEQASINFTKEGVKFNKYENHAQLMQISAENLQEEPDLRHVENRQIKKELEKLIQDYKQEKTASTDVTMRIILKDEEPVCQHPRRLAFTERQEVNKQMEEWLNEGIIRPSSSEYASPIVMVKKKDGSSRMCIDYRKLNQKLVKDKFPLPIIEDVLDTLQEAKVYSTLDLRNGFFHVDVDEVCRKYTSFIVPDGQFEFNKVPFGLSTSPGVFQRYVSSIFRDLTRKGIVISYLDDLVIPAKNEQEGLEKLKIIFEVAKKYGLEIKFKKCQFLKKKIEFLGHIVESGTIKPSPTKTLAVRKFLEPTTIKQVQNFLGLTGYFRKYIKDYSKIAKPLSDLTRKENLFVFGTQQKKAFEKLKKIMSEGPILHLYNISEDYAKKKELITRIARWALQLEEFDYEIEHRAGSRMKHVDALSRYPVMMVCNDTLTSKLKNAQEEDDNIQTFKSLLEKQESEEFFERNGILYKYLNGRELIVTPKAMKAELIKLIHENGHFSVGKTEEIVKQEFFIPNLSNVVKKVIVNCVPCILANKKTGKKERFLNPISKESILLSTYHVDFIGPLPSTNKSYQHIFTVVDGRIYQIYLAISRQNCVC
ncbi:retrovirus-related Pol polyprotein from transposon 17.6 [Trichonephila clavipes]|uniref:RNA-directed DNA polymerase n=1 Tax=Trichonephila clavipes TaxID=2585209 RepID=A0A8X6W8P6_TRICX|nr:retrovirus-related Pol polyprotein from transposon 17.6 [Trichonephila clavipes]